MRLNLSASAAEDLLATIWIALEKHGLTSPDMRILSRDTKLDIELLFVSRRDEDLVKAELPPAMARPEPVHVSFARRASRARAMLSSVKCAAFTCTGSFALLWAWRSAA